MNHDIIFVTAFKDIDRKNWDNYSRSDETYFSCFYRLAKNIEYLLVVYLEPFMIEKIKDIKFNNNIIFRNLDEVNTFYNKYIEIDNQIIDSDEYKSKIPPHRKNNPEHSQYGYNLTQIVKYALLNIQKKNQIISFIRG